MNYQNSYIVSCQFLGFRFHGWQKQPDVKTIHFIIDKTLKFVLKKSRFKTIGVGRTDAKVSSLNYYFQLFVDKPIDKNIFINSFNLNSPSDLRVSSIKIIKDVKFNLIQHPKVKEYHYYFSNNGKNHPYAAPFMTGFNNLDIDLMKKGAKLFEGKHYFHKYCSNPTEKTIFKREIEFSKIKVNSYLSADFFPKISYAFIVRGKGFLRYQIRLMMAVLIELGKYNISLNDIVNSLVEDNDREPFYVIVPGSGLHLFSVEYLEADNLFEIF